MGAKQLGQLTALMNSGLQLLIEIRTESGKKVAITRIDRKNQIYRAKQGNSQHYALKLRVQDGGKPGQITIRSNSSTKWLLDFCYLQSERYG